MPAAWTPPAAADLAAGNCAALERWCFLRLLGEGDVLRGYSCTTLSSTSARPPAGSRAPCG
eukprot:1590057-Prymnesium_polylepis.1